jgi:multidrug efflux pump subunit AcrA (membrane-fusion protein)
MHKPLIASAILLLAVFDSPAQQPAGKNRNDPKNRSAAGSLSSVIEVPRCRIKFIQEATLAAGQSGILKFVTPVEGSSVEGPKAGKPGQLVAGLEDDILRVQLAIAQQEAKNHIDVLFAKKSHEVAKVELEKAKSANVDTPGTVPEVEILRLKLAAEKASLQIELAEHKDKINQLTVKQREAELKTHEIRAPFDGVVINVFKHKGEAVRQGDPILEVVNPHKVRAEALVPLNETLRIKKGDKVDVVLDAPGLGLSRKERTFQGEVTFVDVGVNFATPKARVWVTVENRNGLLRAGQQALLQIHPSGAAK